MPQVATLFAQHLENVNERRGCLQEATASRQVVDDAGFRCPSWSDIVAGARPRQPDDGEPCEWKHGWQFWACRSRFYRA